MGDAGVEKMTLIRILTIPHDKPEYLQMIESNLDDIKKIVGGYFGESGLFIKGLMLRYNDDGLILKLPHNPKASILYAIERNGGGHIVGNAFVVRINEIGDDVSLTDRDIEMIRELIK